MDGQGSSVGAATESRIPGFVRVELGTSNGTVVGYWPKNRFAALAMCLTAPLWMPIKAVRSVSSRIFTLLTFGANRARGPVEGGPSVGSMACNAISLALLSPFCPVAETASCISAVVLGPNSIAARKISAFATKMWAGFGACAEAAQEPDAGLGGTKLSQRATEQLAALARHIPLLNVLPKWLAVGTWSVEPLSKQRFRFWQLGNAEYPRGAFFQISKDGQVKLEENGQTASTIQKLFHVSDEASFNQRYVLLADGSGTPAEENRALVRSFIESGGHGHEGEALFVKGSLADTPKPCPADMWTLVTFNGGKAEQQPFTLLTSDRLVVQWEGRGIEDRPLQRSLGSLGSVQRLFEVSALRAERGSE